MFFKGRTEIPYDTDMSFMQGQDCMKREEFALASLHFADALLAEPDCSDYLISFAMANLKRGGIDNLINAARVLTRIRVDQIPLSERYLPGRVLEMLGRHEEAKEAYFDALASAYEDERAPELACVHYHLSGLSEKHKLKMKRPKGYKAPITNIWLETQLSKSKIVFQLRVFKRKKSEVRLISVMDSALVDTFPSIRRRIVKEVRRYFGESSFPVCTDDIIWVFHYPYDEYDPHLLEELILEENLEIRNIEMSESKFELLSGYRLLWSSSDRY